MSKSNSFKISNIIYCVVILFLVAMLCLCSSGIYRKALKSSKESEALRESISYVKKQIKSHDNRDCIGLYEDGSGIYLKEYDDESCFVLHIYYYDSSIREKYIYEADSFEKEEGEYICSISSFKAELLKDDLLALKFGDDASYVKLFSKGGSYD